MDDKKVREILKKYNEGTCSEEEKEWVESWYLKAIDFSNAEEVNETELTAAKKNIWKNITKKRGIKSLRPKLYYRIAAAASIMIAMGFALYFWQTNNNIVSDNKEATYTVKPGGNKAYLTLADGSKINLSEIGNGQLTEQLGIKVIKKSNGELVYEVTDVNSLSNNQENVFNTIETPSGGQYHVTLPDGTRVWLNAVSSLRYPVSFGDSERRVELVGEGYFEVQSDKQRPFRVVSEEQTIEVLGTKFNINSYTDEPDIRTTLLEGSVKVSNHKNYKILRPGQQSVIANTGNITVNAADTEQATAWYKGDFAFEGAELSTIMRQIGRWYNVDVVYEGDVADVKFGGSISRSKDIKEVLQVLAMTQGVNFKLEGRRILVMP